MSYTISIVLKNGKNRNVIEPNRFELSPKCSQVVKFLLNAEHSVNVDDDFIIEGCSNHLTVRELIRESKLKANIIKPAINFSVNELIFNCYYGQIEDLSSM